MKKNRNWENHINKLADENDLEIVEIEIQKESAGKFLRIFIDTPKGVDLNICEFFHKLIMPHLENVDYDYLEVCSPGADRPLKLARDYEKNIGRKIEVKSFAPIDGQKQFAGALLSFDEEGFIIETQSGEKRFGYKEIAIARPIIDMASYFPDGE